jgi:hypothetical protein
MFELEAIIAGETGWRMVNRILTPAGVRSPSNKQKKPLSFPRGANNIGVMYLASRPATLPNRCGFTKVGSNLTTVARPKPSRILLSSSSLQFFHCNREKNHEGKPFRHAFERSA